MSLPPIHALSMTAVATLLLAACGDSRVEPSVYAPHPEPPAIERDVAMVNDDVEFSNPFVPGHRTTMDGRIAVRVQGGPPGTNRLAQNLSFYVFAPERLEEPILSGPAGPEILADLTPWDVPFPPALDEKTDRLGHHAICDPISAFPTEGERPNPYACGPEQRHDCYDITLINSTSTGLSTQLWGTPVTVEVSEPKTADAQIVDVSLGAPVAGIKIGGMNEFTEPAVTSDGRLLTGRMGRFPREWTNPETGETLIRGYDLAYFQLPDDAQPCDVTGWTQFHPMSHAPYDPKMKGRYGIAAYPFRDTEGQPIPDGEDMGGTYPWVDREASNVFMTGIHGRISEQSHDRYPRSCVTSGCEDIEENIHWDRGFMVGGLWTHGKMVHLDGMINNIDWAVGVTPDAHWLVDLYQNESGPAAPVRFGSGRFVEEARRSGGPYPAGYTHNANIMDSLQNLLNWRENSRPITPRDVVWIMSSGVATDEIAFDDILDPNAFIVSNMQASITQLYDEEGRSTSIPHHHNGQVRALDGIALIGAMYELFPEEDEDIHLQNGATSLRWNVPAYGLVTAGTGRVEPVALGGVQGRGFWLSGTNEIRYAVPAQPQSIRDTDWTIGLHVDPRYADDETHTLFTWPDGSQVRLLGRSTVQYVRKDRVRHEIDLPESNGWMHLGWQLVEGNKTITFAFNGQPIDRWTSSKAFFEMTEGDFVVGQAGEHAWGMRGWIDNLKVLAHRVNREVLCNHAGGTMIRVHNGPWLDRAAESPEWVHSELAAELGDAEGTQYACYLDLSTDYGAHLANIPADTDSLREAINFPEGPIYTGAPRPDSSHNGFCLSCHSEAGQGGLGLDALVYRGDVNAENDPRRQPSQPPRRIFGNIPAGWLAPDMGPGSPTEATIAPPEGYVIDHWMMPSVSSE